MSDETASEREEIKEETHEIQDVEQEEVEGDEDVEGEEDEWDPNFDILDLKLVNSWAYMVLS